MANQWLRLWHELPNDPKLRAIAKLSNQPTVNVLGVYIHMLVEASANATERGRTQPNAEAYATALDLEESDILVILDLMEGRLVSNGWLMGWTKRQPKREDESAARSRRWREQQQVETKARPKDRTQPNATERNRTLDKIREDKIKTKKPPSADSSAKTYPDDFLAAMSDYPPREGNNPRDRAFRAWKARLREGHTPEQLHDGVIRYKRYIRDKGKSGTEFVQQAATFFGPSKPFAEKWEVKSNGANEDRSHMWAGAI